MSLMEKIKSMFSGGSSDDAHDHDGHDHSHEPVAPMPPAEPAGLPTTDTPSEESENRL